jgi:hypothetical protein
MSAGTARTQAVIDREPVDGRSHRDGRRHIGVIARHASFAVLGLVLGLLFWQSIGFWQFLRAGFGSADRPAAPIAWSAPSGEFETQQHRAEREARQCVTLVRDPASGLTQAQGCIIIIRSLPRDIEARASASGLTAERLDLARTTAAR